MFSFNLAFKFLEHTKINYCIIQLIDSQQSFYKPKDNGIKNFQSIY